MQLYNTLSGKKETLEKPKGRPFYMFVCGPTVYDYAHIGHARTYLAYDTFVRYLKNSKRWDVLYLQNITDIDDKIIARAKERGETPEAIASFFKNSYFEDMHTLGIESVDHYAPASEFIPEIVKQVRTLEKKGIAYRIEADGIYFDIAKFPSYGKLSRRTATQAEDAVSRIDESVAKRNRGDFALWKFPKTPPAPDESANFALTEDGEPAWRTELGWGRPGWHIEDTAITEHYLGPQYDLHGGAIELKFPHHEAEIAQQEAASGKEPLVRIWMHTGLLTIEGKKMSKSLGNFITIRDIAKKYPPELLRWFFLGFHYRSPIDYSEKSVREAQITLEKLRLFSAKLAFAGEKNGEKKETTTIAQDIARTKQKFEEALEDDFNTPAAIACLFVLETEYQERLWTLSYGEAEALRGCFFELLSALGIPIIAPSIPENIRKIAIERDLSRDHKQFTHADTLRDEIRVLGYSIEDTPLGTFIYKL